MQEMTDLTFEQAFQELEQVVAQLESGELPLERSLALFERGMALAQLCGARLDQAEQRVSQLTGVGSDGPVLTPLQGEE